MAKQEIAKKAIKVGDEVFVVNPRIFAKPTAGTVRVITKAPGKTIGIEFDKAIGRNCLDGRCRHPHGIWATVSQVLNAAELKALEDRLALAAKREKLERTGYDSLSLELDPQTQKVKAAFN